jgi:hypothetical protein
MIQRWASGLADGGWDAYLRVLDAAPELMHHTLDRGRVGVAVRGWEVSGAPPCVEIRLGFGALGVSLRARAQYIN